MNDTVQNLQVEACGTQLFTLKLFARSDSLVLDIYSRVKGFFSEHLTFYST